MIFDENTEYLLCTVKAGKKECYKDFDVTQAWNVMLEATNTEETVTLIVKRMSSSQARSIFYGRQKGTVQGANGHKNSTVTKSLTLRYSNHSRTTRHTP